MNLFASRSVRIIIFFCFCLLTTKTKAATFSATLSCTPVHKTCYSGGFAVNYVATVTVSLGPNDPRSYTYGTNYEFIMTGSTTNFKLRTTASGINGTVLATNNGGTVVNSTISGSFDISAISPAQSPRVYTVYATIKVNDITGNQSVILTPSAAFTVGYQTTWSQMTEMHAHPNIYSAKRNISTLGQTYANAISANMIPASTTGWASVAPQFNGNTGSVFVVIGSSSAAITDPTTQTNYVEFRRTGASSGAVYVKIGGSTYTLSGVTYNSRIRIVRNTTSQIRFYFDNTETVISGPPAFTYSGDWNVGVFATQLGDGVVSVVTSAPCIFDNQYYYLKDEVEESVAYVNGSKLKIKFDEDYYDYSGTLTYSIQCLNDDSTPSISTVAKTKHENWLDIPLTGFVSGNVYLVTVRDTKGRVKYLKFKKA